MSHVRRAPMQTQGKVERWFQTWKTPSCRRPESPDRGVLGDSEFSRAGLRSAFWISLHMPAYFYEFADEDSLNSSAHFVDIHYLSKLQAQEA